MTNDLLTALAGFALVSSITPGPNNLMLMASGANYGFRRSIPHMLGIASGFVVMVCLVGVGLIGLFDAWPPAHTILTVVSVAYLLWLAWKIAHASAPRRGEGTGRPAAPGGRAGGLRARRDVGGQARLAVWRDQRQCGTFGVEIKLKAK